MRHGRSRELGSEEGPTTPRERSAESLREAREAEGTVAASDDITSRDDERAGEYSEDPGGEGGHP